MEQNKQHKPMMTEEQKQMLRKAMEEDKYLRQTDPEYRALWEKREQDLRRFIFPGDCIED